MHIEVHGLNHKTSPIEIRERLSICGDALEDALSKYRKYPGVEQCLILSTCNRTEIYTLRRNNPELENDLPGTETSSAASFLADYNRIEENQFVPYLYHYCGREAVEHLFRVVCGVDSMVLGENEILGQFRSAFSMICEIGTNGTCLNKLAHSAIRLGKEVRTKTGLNKGSLSVGYASCDLATEAFGKLTDAVVLVIGSGEAGKITAENLQKRGARRIVVTNRTLSKAQYLAEHLGCDTISFDKLEAGLIGADIVISCTASCEPILTLDMMKRVMLEKGSDSRIVLIDLAVPRDIESSASTLRGVQLYNIDALEKVIEENSKMRKSEAEKANNYIQSAVEDFDQWQRSLIAVPTIRELQVLFETIKREEIDRWCLDASEEELERIERVTNMIIGRIAKLAITEMKAATAEPQGKDFIDHVKRLFDLTEV